MIATTQRLLVLPDEPIAEIQPYLHGHFAEHLGELVYPGVWVSPDGPVPNSGGLRRDVLDALRPLQIPVLRWPGGCFADDYQWRDGVGPPDARPLRVNRHWGMTEEPGHFGTHEFLAFCRELGAEPYLAANLGSGTPAELRDWAEYCNFAGRSALADQRRANGAPEPFGVRFWGIGNENWGCGGNLSPEHYAEEFCRYRTYLSSYPGTPVEAIACGQNNADWEWTRRFFGHLRDHYRDRLRLVQGYAAHYYCGTAGTATEFTCEQWLELLCRAYAIDGVIAGCRLLMDEYDPERRIRLLFDEWGTWHPVEPGKPPRGLYQQNTMRDACAAALTLDLFHQHAEKLFMCNLAQLVNVLQALLLADESRCFLTPTYHVFALYRPHRGAVSVRVHSCAETVSGGEASAAYCRSRYLDRGSPFALRAVHGSASLFGGRVCVTAVNTHPEQPVELEVSLHGARWGEVEAVGLGDGDLRAHNTFDQPHRVAPSAPRALAARGSEVRVTMPPGSVVRLRGGRE